jgi:DsbC/DsbD-like thiol-disulfide interchange protein
MNFRFKLRNNLMIILIAIGLFFLGRHVYVSAEEEVVQVKTFISKDGVHLGKKFKVAFLVEIISGWHINAHELADEFLIPTSLTFEEKENVEVLKYYYPEPKLAKFDYSEEELQIFEDKAVLGALVSLGKDLGLGRHKLKAKLRYQACDHRSCLPPKTLNFEIDFNVVEASQETKEINQEIFSKIDFEKGNRLRSLNR